MKHHYQLLPEWAAQSGVLITWPHPDSDWGPWLPRVEPVYLELVRHISRRERLLITCRDDAHLAQVRASLSEAALLGDPVTLHRVTSDDTWTRDYGPITVLEQGQPRLLDFTFNGWGGKFDARNDNLATRRLHAAGAFGATPLETVDMVLEGGGIESDGLGTLLTTEQCLLAPTRNPHLSRAHIERRLRALFGLERFLWLQHGHLAGDDTDSHIDTLARFCDPHTIAYVACDDPGDEHYADLQAMEQELRAFRDRDGLAYRLIPLPWPAAKHDESGKRLPASYANFLIINGAVLVPTYEDRADDEALRRLREGFPAREVIGVPCLPLIHQYGSLHCVTMQLPAGIL